MFVAPEVDVEASVPVFTLSRASMIDIQPKLHVVSAELSAASEPKAEVKGDSCARIRAELNRVLSSPQFDSSERNRRFLEYVVEETLAGRADRIKAYNVATTVFGRDDSFDPQLDPVVRMEARRLRRALERLYLVEGDAGPLRITLPKGGYVPRFEEPPDPSFAEEPAPEAIRNAGRRRRGPSIQVSAFAVEDERPSAEYGDGFVRHLAVGLSRFPEFDVFTAQPLAGSCPHADSPGSSPCIDLILVGDTSVAADVFRVKATLIHGRSGRVVWGETFEDRIGDKGVLETRDRIADRIVRTLGAHGAAILNCSFGGELKDAGNLASLEGLIHFSRYQRWPRRDLYSLARIRLERAAAIEPDNSETFACLSQIYSDSHRYGFAPAEKASQLRRLALEAAGQAVELSPTSSRAHHAQGVAYWYAGDDCSSLAALETALALNPNATAAMADLGLYRCLLGDWDIGIRLIEDSMVGKPTQTGIQRVGLSLHLFRTGEFERALGEASRIGTPHITHGFVAKAISLVRLGRRNEARQAVARILELNPRYGQEVLHEFGRNNVHPALAREIETALSDAGLVPISAAS